MPKGTIPLIEYADKILNRLQTKPESYSQLKVILQIPNSTLSKVLNQLLKEDLIVKVIIKNKVRYAKYKKNYLEVIMDRLKKFTAFCSDSNTPLSAHHLIKADSGFAIILLQFFIQHAIADYPITYRKVQEFLKEHNFSEAKLLNILIDAYPEKGQATDPREIEWWSDPNMHPDIETHVTLPDAVER